MCQRALPRRPENASNGLFPVMRLTLIMTLERGKKKKKEGTRLVQYGLLSLMATRGRIQWDIKNNCLQRLRCLRVSRTVRLSSFEDFNPLSFNDRIVYSCYRVVSLHLLVPFDSNTRLESISRESGDVLRRVFSLRGKQTFAAWRTFDRGSATNFRATRRRNAFDAMTFAQSFE